VLADRGHDRAAEGLPPGGGRYDKLAHTFLDAITLAAIYALWL